MGKGLGPAILLVGALALARTAQAQSYLCEDQFTLDDSVTECLKLGPEKPPPLLAAPVPKPDPLRLRMLKYVAVASKHRLCGLASYYSASLDGTLTANGERYRNKRLSAAHLTLPLGSWIEVTSRSTGKKIRCRVNDRGPYVSKFMLDLSYAAAHALGVDIAEDRHVDVRLIALPGDDPLPEAADWTFGRNEEAATPIPATAVAAR
ncbi:MAG: rlpA [Acidobacteria bacterium]|nr:rlpA [Acidobacteriota bacterium]